MSSSSRAREKVENNVVWFSNLADQLFDDFHWLGKIKVMILKYRKKLLCSSIRINPIAKNRGIARENFRNFI